MGNHLHLSALNALAIYAMWLLVHGVVTLFAFKRHNQPWAQALLVLG